jgi:hypothetical protein
LASAQEERGFRYEQADRVAGGFLQLIARNHVPCLSTVPTSALLFKPVPVELGNIPGYCSSTVSFRWLPTPWRMGQMSNKTGLQLLYSISPGLYDFGSVKIVL